MARYWVGDTNPAIWNDTNHWSATDGGAGGAGVPTSSDDVYFTSSNTNSCTFDTAISVASIHSASGYTGTLDNATNDVSVTVAGDVILDNTRVDMGDATWTVSGSFDNKDVTTFNKNLSTLVMNGSGKTLTSSGATRALYSLTINGSTNTNAGVLIYTYGDVVINASFDTSANFILAGSNKSINIAESGSVTGSGNLGLSGSIIISNHNTFDNVTVATLNVSRTHTGASNLPSGTYNSAEVSFSNDVGAGYICEFESGDVIFEGNVTFRNSFATGSYNINNSINNPNINFKGNVTVQQPAGTTTWTKGSGTITFAGTGAQSVNFLDKTVEDINITNTGGIVTFATNGFTGDSLTASAGASLKFQSTKTYAFGTIDLDGAVDNLITLAATTGDSAFLLNVTTAPTVTFVTVSDCNASGGSQITANGGNCIDGGGNTNWLFTGGLATYAMYNATDASLDFYVGSTRIYRMYVNKLETAVPMQIVTKTDANRGSAYIAGRVIYNSDDAQLNIDDGTNWTLPDGTTT